MAKQQNKYRKLLGDTMVFTIGTFSSKFLVYLMMPIYTAMLTTEQYGTADLVVQTANLLLPIVSVGIFNSIIRFGLDKNINKTQVFTIGIKTVSAGFAVMLLFFPLGGYLGFSTEYTILLYLYVLCSMLRSTCSQFVRSMQYIKLYAADGVFATIMVVVFNILFLCVFKMGVAGYLLATILSDFLSAVSMFVVARLYRYLNFGKTNLSLLKDMLRYSIPMIPATACWWITNVSDRFMVSYMISKSANGLYSVSYKIPTLINLVSSVFSDAWQISAVTHNNSPEQANFFSNIYASFTSVMFLGASGLILLCKPIMAVMVADSYYVAWKYVPILVIATVYACFGTFLGSVYVVEKKSNMILTTAAAGAVVNITLNAILIPKIGPNGAAIATMVSYILIYAIRAVNTRHFIVIRMRTKHIFINTVVLLFQSYIMVKDMPYWVIISILCSLFVFVFNLQPILLGIQKVFEGKIRGRLAK